MTSARSRTFTAPVPGPVALDLEASAADVVVTVSPAADAASAELTGPGEIVNAARPALDDGRWGLVLPPPAATGGSVVRVGNATIINATGGMVITGGSMTFVNGRLVGGTNVRTAPMPEPVRLFLTLPAGSRIDARLTAGKLTVRGELAEARIASTSADVYVENVGKLRARTASGDVAADMVTGSATLRTMSGDIDVAETAGDVTAESMSGDITIGTSSPVAIDAESMSGDITVRPYGGAFPDVRARSVSGRVRTRRAGEAAGA